MRKPAPKRRIKRYDGGGSVSSDSGSGDASSAGSTGSTSSGLGSYYNLMSGLRGNLGGSKESPYSTTQGGNSYFNKGGKVGAKAKAKRRR